jgi:adenylyltransferase/sulfurtransferase
MGCLQATEVIKILLGKEGVATGRVLIFDALKMKFGEVGLAKLPDRETITGLIDYQGFCAGPKTSKSTTHTTVTSTKDSNVAIAVTSFDLLKAKHGSNIDGRTMDETDHDESSEEDTFHTITPKDCLDKLSDGWSPWVLDVRLQTEHDIVALPFTDKVSPHRTVKVENIPKSGDVLIYCKAGVRGKKACNRLIELGVTPKRLYNLEGGIIRWQKDIDPSMPRY